MAPKASAASITSAQSGNWSDGSTWLGGAVPGAGDTATLANVVTVGADVVIGNSPADQTTMVLSIAAA